MTSRVRREVENLEMRTLSYIASDLEIPEGEKVMAGNYIMEVTSLGAIEMSGSGWKKGGVEDLL